MRLYSQTRNKCKSVSTSKKDENSQAKAFKSIENIKITCLGTQYKGKFQEVSYKKEQKNVIVKMKQTTLKSSFSRNHKKILPLLPENKKTLQITQSYQKKNHKDTNLGERLFVATSHHGKTNHSILSYSTNQQINVIINEQILPLIIRYKLMNQSIAKHCVFTKQNLTILIKKLISAFQDFPKDGSSVEYINQPLKSVRKLVVASNKSQKIIKNSICSISNIRIYPQQFNQQIQQHKIELLKLSQKYKDLSSEYSILQHKKQQTLKFHNDRVKDIENNNRQIYEKKKRINQLKEEKIVLNNKVEQLTQMLKVISAESQSIFHFVENQQKNQLLQSAADRYKQIEAEIYDFAGYLQGNQMASNLSYEPIPVRYWSNFINNLEEELKTLTKTILYKVEMTLQEKLKRVKDFVMKMYDALKKKHEQLQQSVDFKSRSICNFINMMKKWLQNWQLKQEYLVGLRKQFSFDCQAFQKCMQRIMQNEDYSQSMQQSLGKLKSIHLKLSENYKLGNFFY